MNKSKEKTTDIYFNERDLAASLLIYSYFTYVNIVVSTQCKLSENRIRGLLVIDNFTRKPKERIYSFENFENLLRYLLNEDIEIDSFLDGNMDAVTYWYCYFHFLKTKERIELFARVEIALAGPRLVRAELNSHKVEYQVRVNKFCYDQMYEYKYYDAEKKRTISDFLCEINDLQDLCRC